MLPRRLLRQQIIYKIYGFLPAGQGVLKQPIVVFPLKAEQSTRFTRPRDARSASIIRFSALSPRRPRRRPGRGGGSPDSSRRPR